MFAEDRPAIGYLFSLIYPLLGESPLHWHLYALLLRLLMVFSLFWLLRMLWPQHTLMTTAATLLYAVYPGFLEQTQALTFQVSLTVMLLATLSIGLMVYAARLKSLPVILLLYAASLTLMFLYQLLVEYAVGLEALRLMLLWVALENREKLPPKRALLRLLLWWAPFVLLSGLFIIWRFFFFNSTRPTTDVDRLLLAYSSDKAGMLLRLALEMGRDFIESAFMAWVVPLYRDWYYPSYQQLLAGLVIALLAGAAPWLYFRYGKPTAQANAEERRVSLSWVWIGALSVVFGLLPVLFSNRNVVFQARDARYTLPAMIGASLLLGGLVFLAIKPRLRPWAIAILVGMGVLAHYNAALMKRARLDHPETSVVAAELARPEPGESHAALLEATLLARFCRRLPGVGAGEPDLLPRFRVPHPQWGDPGPLLLALSARRHPQAQDAPRDLDQPQFCPPAGAEHAG